MDVVLFLYLLVTWHVECHLFILTKRLKMESFPYKESVAMMGKICVTWYPVKHWGAFYLGSVYFPLLLNVFTSSAVFCIVEVFLYFSSCQFCLFVHFCDIVLCLVLAIRHDSFVYLYIAVSIWMYCFIITCMYLHSCLVYFDLTRRDSSGEATVQCRTQNGVFRKPFKEK